MLLLWIALAFIHLNFHLTVDQTFIRILPSFLGFVLLFRAVRMFREQSRHFAHLVPISLVMAVLHFPLFLLDLSGYILRLGPYVLIPEILSSLLGLYATDRIIRGIQDMEQASHRDFASASLRQLFPVLAVAALFANISLLSSRLSLPAGIIHTVVVILFLLRFRQTYKRFDAYHAETILKR